jgi:ABC-type oligopeptide transport system ATPase subunit
MSKTKVVNFFAGPGCGKTTIAVSVFSLLKLHGVEVELITEIAKDFTWEERFRTLENQYYIWAKQQHKFWRLKGKVDIIVNDSPLLLSFVYGEKKPKCFYDLVLHDFNEYDNMNFFIKRSNTYNQNGRNENEEGAIIVDNQIKDVLKKLNIEHQMIFNNSSTINSVCNQVLEILNIESELEYFVK